ncbi:MAG: M10 family metallopeptidase C-terminal domain-containing protein [Pelagimonas sp.]|jgi:hypothetical protein|nr:M10 family metallopeptidase C-terminal domain-containing protein [Pelagimonas sp.]
MAIINQTSTTTTVSVGSGDTFYLAEDQSITTIGADAISGNAANAQLFIYGDVTALYATDSDTFGAAIDLYGDNVRMWIGADATITAAGDEGAGPPGTSAIEFSNRSDVVNYGTIISSENGFDFGSGSDGSRLENHGTISADAVAVDMFVTEVEIVNTGLITSAGGGLVGWSSGVLDLINHGTISTGSTAVASVTNGVNTGTISTHSTYAITMGDNADFENRGLIRGGISMNSSGGEFRNSGVIETGTYYIRSSSGDQIFDNSGEIRGSYDNLIWLGSGNDTVRNSGEIGGDVRLGSGNDVFDGRGGMVDGTVQGEFGDDIYIVDDPLLEIVESANQGTDLVQAASDYHLGANLENLELIGSGNTDGIGNELANTLTGNDGGNMISGRAGDDTILGGDGDDILKGGGNRDSVSGEDGDDVIRLGAGGDTGLGGAGDDRIEGRSGDDRLEGGDGNDTLIGGGDEDRLLGGDGDDVLRGGASNDTLTGGAGHDVFDFNAVSDSPSLGYDGITDFTQGEDLIDLRELVEGQRELNLLGSFTGGGVASVRTVETGGDTRVNIDVDGDGARDMRIDLEGITGIAATDFLL